MCGLGYDRRFANPSDEPSESIGKARLTPFEGRERFYDDAIPQTPEVSSAPITE